MVRAWWAEGLDLHSTGQTFELAPGTELDLGLLQPLTGDTLEVTLGIVDSDGQELDPAQVYAGAGSTPFANLSLMALPADGDAVHMLAGLLPLPFGVRFRIHGLQPGRVLASVQPGEGLVMDPIRVSKLEGMQAESFEVGSRRALELALVAHLGSGRPLVVRAPSGLELAVPSVWVHDLAAGTASLVSTRPGLGEEHGAGRMSRCRTEATTCGSSSRPTRRPRGWSGARPSTSISAGWIRSRSTCSRPRRSPACCGIGRELRCPTAS